MGKKGMSSQEVQYRPFGGFAVSLRSQEVADFSGVGNLFPFWSILEFNGCLGFGAWDLGFNQKGVKNG
ncbi:MAG: hypothetical protein N3A65_09700 [candidate division WOR-3 bacterium]|nr:hypothetical protein [candidate division WOR-3 bacterium]